MPCSDLTYFADLRPISDQAALDIIKSDESMFEIGFNNHLNEFLVRTHRGINLDIVKNTLGRINKDLYVGDPIFYEEKASIGNFWPVDSDGNEID